MVGPIGVPGFTPDRSLSDELSGGRSNRSFLLNSDIGKLVLRINGTGSLLPGAGRDNEIRIWQEASKQGIAPPLVFVDSKNQYLVSTYIKNELPPQPQLNPACVDQAFNSAGSLSPTGYQRTNHQLFRPHRALLANHRIRKQILQPNFNQSTQTDAVIARITPQQQHPNRPLPPRSRDSQLRRHPRPPLPDRLGIRLERTANHGLRSAGNRVETGRCSRSGTHEFRTWIAYQG